MIVFAFVISSAVFSLISFVIYYCIYKIFETNILNIKYSKKLSQKTLNKVAVSDKKLSEIIAKLKHNCPKLKSQKEYEKTRVCLDGLKCNFDLPFYVVNISNNDKSYEYIEELCAIKELERQGVLLNLIVISSLSPKRAYNLKYTLASLDFEKDIVRLFCPEDLSAMQNNSLKMLNINYVCGNILCQNNTKSTDYCLKAPNNRVYYAKTHNTMQTDAKSIFCKSFVQGTSVVEQTECFNYLDQTLITRFDFSKACDGNSISKFLPFDGLKYFDVNIADKQIIIQDFEHKTALYLSSNLPVFVGAHYDKTGLYFCHKMTSNFVYFLTSKNEIKDLSLFGCEGALIKAKSLMSSLPKVRVESSNSEIDKLVNKLLPSKIISQFLQRPFEDNNLFGCFANLENKPLQGATTSKLSYLVNRYFDTLKRYYGVEFGESGLYLTKQKTQLLSSRLTFKKGSISYTLQIKNTGLNGETFKFREIEYTGINYIAYDKLSSSLVLQM